MAIGEVPVPVPVGEQREAETPSPHTWFDRSAKGGLEGMSGGDYLTPPIPPSG